MPGSSTELSDQSNTELEKTYFGSNYYYQSTATYENYPSFLINFFKVKYTELEVWWLFYKLLSVFSYQQFAINIIFWSNLIILSLWLKKNKTFGKEIKCAQYQHWVIQLTGFCKADLSFLLFFYLKKIHVFQEWSHYTKKKTKFSFHFLLQERSTLPKILPHLFILIHLLLYSVTEWLTGIKYLKEITKKIFSWLLQQNLLKGHSTEN